MIKKYLKEIEYAGIIMLFLGFILGHVVSIQFGAMIVVVGMLLWIFTVVVKALNWKQYSRDNIVNVYIILGAILAILVFYFLRK